LKKHPSEEIWPDIHKGRCPHEYQDQISLMSSSSNLVSQKRPYFLQNTNDIFFYAKVIVFLENVIREKILAYAVAYRALKCETNVLDR